MKIVKTIITYFVALVICVISFLPLYILIKLAFAAPTMSMQEVVTKFNVVDLHNFVKAWESSNLGTAIKNSAIIVIGTLFIGISVSAMAGYAIARFTNWYNNLFFKLLMFAMMVPAILNAVPLYIIMNLIHGLNTRWAIMLLLATNMLPFSIFVYTSFVKSIPTEVEEAAIVDGCSRFGSFWRITWHFLKPATASIIIIQGVGIWNNYAQVVFYLTKSDLQTLPLAINSFFYKYGAEWNSMAAASLIGLLPTIILFIMFQKYFIKGITAGALKG